MSVRNSNATLIHKNYTNKQIIRSTSSDRATLVALEPKHTRSHTNS